MHPSEIDVLRQNLSQQDKQALRQTVIHQGDGFTGLKALLPPPTRRGIVLIDPSYEDKNDYRQVIQTLNDGIKRFATGCYAVWHPLVQRREATELARALERLKVQWTHATLTVRAPVQGGYGLHGSGMFVVNPPYTLYERLEQALPWRAQTLALDDRAGYTLTRSK